jgi:hypothetical protein
MVAKPLNYHLSCLTDCCCLRIEFVQDGVSI